MLPSACRDAETSASSEPPRIELKAEVAPFEAVTVVAPIEGRVVELRVTDGASVNAGDLLVRLANPVVTRDLVYARTTLDRLDAPSHPARTALPTVARDDRRLRSIEEIVKQREQRLERVRRLLADGDVAKQDVENAEAELAAARRDLAAEQERLTTVAAAPSMNPAMLEIEKQRARADLEFAEHRQSLLTIVAPAAGSIARLRVAPGRDVYVRDPIADIVDARTASVRAPIAPELLRFVRAGQPIDVRVMTIPVRRFREPIARVIQPGAEGGAAIIVNIPNPDRTLQAGTSAMLTIQ